MPPLVRRRVRHQQETPPPAPPGSDDIDAGTVDVAQGPTYATAPIELEKGRDHVRANVTYGGGITLALTIFGALAAAIFLPDSWQNVKDILLVILPAETALFGSIIGFYFASGYARPNDFRTD